jgi:hypothetical protein
MYPNYNLQFKHNNIEHLTSIKYEIIGKEERVISTLYIRDVDGNLQDIGEFKLSKNDGINTLNAFINDEYQGKGYSWILLYCFFTFINNNKKRILRGVDLLVIDTDASFNDIGDSYWEKLGLTKSRYADYPTKSRFPLAGYEKSIQYKTLYNKNYKKSRSVTLKFLKHTSIGGKMLDISTINKSILIDFLNELNIKCLNIKRSELIKLIKNIDLNKLKISQLKSYCKIFKIKGYSKYSNKQVLIQHIQKNS